MAKAIFRNLPTLGLATLVALLLGCGKPTTMADLTPRISHPTPVEQRIQGTIHVQTSVTARTNEQSHNKRMNITLWLDAPRLKGAIETALAQDGLFSRVVPGEADYVLDVWVDDIQTRLEIMGEGYIYDLKSIWRLIRAKDGTVTFCDFVQGHGAGRALADRVHPLAIGAATREMIQAALSRMADQTTPHLAALQTAGLRKSMGPASPAGYAEWSAKVQENWQKLKTGQTIEEVEALLGPVRKGAALTGTHTKGATERFTTGQYNLIFINGRLSLWERLAPPVKDQAAPPTP